MARPKSEDKRNSILAATIAVFAKKGIGAAPTSSISTAAGVAEGTLFTYFATKNILMNELYRALKRELAETLLAEFPETGDIRSKFLHVWDRYVRWGVENPQKLKVMAELRILDKITAESRSVGYEPFARLERAARDSIKKKEIRNYPVPFIGAIMGSMAETTMTFVAENKKSHGDFSAMGFASFWNGIANH